MENNSLNASLISVLMPLYNAERYLKAAIESILQQTYHNFELLLINDGSNDESEKIIKSFQDKRIVYIKNENNLGLIASLNKGIKIAKGNYLARMDADDIAIKERFEKQINEFVANPQTVVVGTNYFLLNKNKKSYKKYNSESDYLKANLLFSTCFCHPTVMINRLLLSELSYDSRFKHAEDYHLWTQLVGKGRFTNLQVGLLIYRHNSNQVSNTYRHEQIQISNQIRADYCHELGFKFSQEELDCLNKIGNNIPSLEVKDLIQIDDFLRNLLSQNKKLNCFPSAILSSLILKNWLDVCGNTPLGTRAFMVCMASPISKKSTVAQKIKLLAKCILRKRYK